MRWVKLGSYGAMNHAAGFGTNQLNLRQGGLTAADQQWQGDRASETDWFECRSVPCGAFGRWPTAAARVRAFVA